MDNTYRSDKLRACPCLPYQTNESESAENRASLQTSNHNDITLKIKKEVM
jgi:hypothetical protein